jgi:hypothetical protein
MFDASFKKSPEILRRRDSSFVRLSCIFASLLAFAPSATFATEAERFPVFDGTVIPITSPHIPEYRSYDSELVIVSLMRAEGEKEERSGSTVQSIVRRIGDTLTQRIRLVDLRTGRSGLPRKDRELLSAISVVTIGDVRGNVKTTSIEGIEDLARRFPDDRQYMPGTAEYNSLIAYFSGLTSGIEQLPLMPVTTGSVLYSVKLGELLSTADFPPDLAAIFPDEQIDTMVKGFGYYEGRKVLVTETLSNPTLHMPQDMTGSLVFGGYTLYDAHSMGIVRADFLALLTLENLAGKSKFSFRMAETQEGKVQNAPDK